MAARPPKHVQFTITGDGSLDAKARAARLRRPARRLRRLGRRQRGLQARPHDHDDDRAPHRARRRARRHGEGPPRGHRVPARHGPRAAAVAVARAGRAHERARLDADGERLVPGHRARSTAARPTSTSRSRSTPTSWSRATAATSPPSAWPAISSSPPTAATSRARDLNAISVAATTNAGDVDVAFTTQPVSVSANIELRRRARHRARRRRVPRRRDHGRGRRQRRGRRAQRPRAALDRRHAPTRAT